MAPACYGNPVVEDGDEIVVFEATLLSRWTYNGYLLQFRNYKIVAEIP